MRVDYQCHWYPESYLRHVLGRDGAPFTRKTVEGYLFEGLREDRRNISSRFFDLDEQIADLDANGIDVMVCSPNMVGEVTSLPIAEARDTTQLLNEEFARAQRENPGRFVGLAMLPMQDVSAAIETAEYAINELGLGGVCMLSHVDGQPIGNNQNIPIFEAIARLNVPIFLHPTHRSSIFSEGQVRPIETGMNWMYDTTLSAASLIFSGLLDRLPSLRFVHPHAGGVFPYIAGRVDALSKKHDIVAEDLPELQMSVTDYLRERFYVDSAVQTPGALQLAAATYGSDRILFASDYPWQDRPARINFVRENVDNDLAHAILDQNQLPGLNLVADQT